MLSRLAVSLCAVVLLAGCGGSSDSPTDVKTTSAGAGPISFDNPAVTKKIEKNFGDCLDKLKSGPVAYDHGNIWSATTSKGRLNWRAAYNNQGGIVMFPDDRSDDILDKSGCYDG